MKKIISITCILAFALSLPAQSDIHTIQNGDLIIRLDDKLFTNIHSQQAQTALESGFYPSEFITVRKQAVTDFTLKDFSKTTLKNQFGSGIQYRITGLHNDDKYQIEKQLTITCYEDFPDMAVYQVRYINRGGKTLKVTKWANQHYRLDLNPKDSVFWSLQGSSTSNRADWILPIHDDFYQRNYLGMNNSDYGGGIPVLDVWRSDAGVAIGHTTLYPQLVSMPVEREEDTNTASMAIAKQYAEPYELEPGDTLATLETFVMTHRRDCFHTLREYTAYMKVKGLKFAEPEPSAYEPIWCAWGYERGFTLDEIIGTLPKVKELGFKWAVLDDGFQLGEGDWDVNPVKFPKGNRQMKAFVDTIHSFGLKAKLWWAPLAVDPCTNLLNNNPDIILYTDEWAPRIITWWDAYYMSPVYRKTLEHTQQTLTMFLDEWGFDGLKMDGQHMNAVPPDHHPNHGLDYPEQACEQLPDFFKMVYDSARVKKNNAVIENCPCGCAMSFYNMPYINQAVSSDPLSSWQIRLKGKVYKAILGETAYYGDHVELSDEGEDFASSFGVGAVLGSKFTWPKDNPTAEASYLLTPEREKKWKKWIGLYNDLMLSKEPYLGELYDIGFDKPEAHVIQKGKDLYYAFYAPSWKGDIELRGLSPNSAYEVIDYVNDRKMGVVTSNHPVLNTSFKKHLLIVLKPIDE